MVVVVGAGAQGAACAYYLSRSGIPVTVFDAVGRDSSKTGCSRGAGVFIGGETWGVPKAQQLHRKTFDLHAKLAEELDLKSYRELPVARVKFHASNDGDDVEEDSSQSATDTRIPWLHNWWHSPIPGRAAQVDPSELVESLLEKSCENDAQILKGSVMGCNLEGDNKVVSVELDNGDTISVENDDIVFTIGAWSSQIEDWLAVPMPIEGIWSTSLIWNSDDVGNVIQEDPAALFCEEDMNGCHLEILPRLNGSLYVSGCGQSRVLSPAIFRSTARPEPGKTNKPDPSRVVAATAGVKKLMPNVIVNNPEVTRACIRPVSPDGVPIIGRIPNISNAFVATGGGPWGITFAPVVGQSISRLISEGDPPVNLRDFSPRRFDTPVYRTLLRQRGKQAEGKAIGEQW